MNPDSDALFGREDILSALLAACRSEGPRRVAAVLVRAASGVGKSTLLRRLATLASPENVVLSTKISPGFAGDGGIVEQLLAQVRTNVPSREQSPAAQIAATAKRKPVLILIDDVDLACENELQEINQLCALSRRSRVFIAMTLRDIDLAQSPIAAALNAWRLQGIRTISLAPLEAGDARLLVWNLAARSKTALAPDIARKVITVSGGNPRYITELVEEISTSKSPQLVPISALAVVGHLRSRMPDSVFEIIATAAVIGTTFCGEWLSELGPWDERSIAHSLQIGCDFAVLRERPGKSDWFTFVEIAVAEALRASIVSRRRKLLHRDIAGTLIRLKVDPPHDRLIALHMGAGDLDADAKQWFKRVGERLSNEGAPAEAADCFRQASELCEPASDELIQLLRQSAESYKKAGLNAYSISVLEKLVDTLEQRSPKGALPMELERLFFDYCVAERWLEAERTVERLNALTEPDPGEFTQYANTAWAMYLSTAGDSAQARRALALVEANPPKGARSASLFLVGKAVVNGRIQPIETTINDFDRALSMAEASTVIDRPIMVNMFAAEIAASLGYLMKARAYDERARCLIEHSSECSEGLRIGYDARHIEICVLSGELEAAQSVLRSFALSQGLSRGFESIVRGTGAFVAARIGDWSMLQAFFLPQLLQASASRHNAESCGVLLRGFAELMSARGLEAELQRAISSFVEYDLVDPYCWIQQAAAQYGDLSSIDQAREQLLSRRGGTDDIVVVAAIEMFDAHTALRAGRPMNARRAATRAAHTYSELRWPLFEARALELAGDNEAAIAIYAQHRCVADVARVRSRSKKGKKRSTFSTPLTPREREVATLVERGFANKEIARTLGASDQTIHHHVSAVLSKLGLRSRFQIRPEHTRQPEPYS